MASSEEPLDLYDLAVLLNYERAQVPPHQVARIALGYPERDQGWIDNARTWVILDFFKGDSNTRDVPAHFLREEEDLTKNLSQQQVETIFHQIRAHDGCYQAIGLLQIFFALFPPSTKLRIRHAPKEKGSGESYITSIERRIIIEETLVSPQATTVAIIVQEGQIRVSGNQEEMDHAVVGFMHLDSDAIATTLDLSSMQFGNAGRGPGTKGKELFALDTIVEFEMRIKRIAESTDDMKSNRSLAISGTPVDDWLREVALRAKRRWENKETEKWCGHCGSPDAKSKCAGCGEEWYCGREHQKLGWAFHKGYCKTA